MLLHLPEIELGRDLDAFLDVLALEAASGQYDERFGQLSSRCAGKRNVLSLIQVGMENFALLRKVLKHVLEVLHPVAYVSRFVLHYEAEDLLVHVGRREIFAEAEKGQHVALGDEMQRD